MREPFAAKHPDAEMPEEPAKNLLAVLESLNGIELPTPLGKRADLPSLKGDKQGAEVAKVSENADEPRGIAFSLEDWPTSPQTFVQSRALLCRNNTELPIHFREARGVDYNAKRNLLYSLLSARNHMALITVAEGDDLDLASYTVLPLSLDGAKDDPGLLALDLRRGRLKRFRVRNITRVKEVFYSLINVCLLSLLPSSYIFALETRFQDEAGI